MFCSKCGKSIPDGSGFCLHCGQMQSATGSNNQLPSLPPPIPTGQSQSGCGKKAGCFFAVLLGLAVVGNILSNILPPNEQASTSGKAEKTAHTTTQRQSEQQYQAPIMPNAVTTYPETAEELKKAGFPKMLAKLGLETIKKCNKLMPLAAQKAARNNKCDAVMMVDISDRSTKENPIIYVTAKNGTRFYFSEKEITSNTTAVSEQEQLAPLLWRHEVMAEEVIKSKLQHPSTYDRHELGIFQSETTANCNQIVIEFSAKNSFGVELTYVACVQFDKDSNVVGFHMQEKN